MSSLWNAVQYVIASCLSVLSDFLYAVLWFGAGIGICKILVPVVRQMVLLPNGPLQIVSHYFLATYG